jgi:hypothetical protein
MTTRRALAMVAFIPLAVCVAPLGAQAFPRADLPPGGAIRLTFDPRISQWYSSLRDGVERPLGFFFGGVPPAPGADPKIPLITRLQEDIRVATGSDAYLAILGGARLSVRAERRETPLLLEVGITDRLAIGVRVPVVRVKTSAAFRLDSTQANLGQNPRTISGSGADATYAAFFGEFDGALATIQQNITNGAYGPPGSGTRLAAQAFADSADAVRAALFRAAFGVGPGDAAPFLPTATSATGLAIAANLSRIQQRFAAGFGVAGFDDTYLLPTALMSGVDVNAAMASENGGFGAAPFADTRRALRFWLGDVELQGRLGLIRSPNYLMTVGALVRLPTGHQDSPNNLLDLSAGDHQLDVEGDVTQDAIIGGRLWLNLRVRVGIQQPGERARRVGPTDLVLIPRAATTLLSWDPGDYLLIDLAPLYRFTPRFAAGLTAQLYTQRPDRYEYRSSADSLAVATALGAPRSAALLDAGTAVRSLRLGGAVTFTGPVLDGACSVERVISGRGADVPVMTVFRIGLRTTFRLF